MVILLIFEFILKAVLLVLGILALNGQHWAAVTFAVIIGLLGLFDLVMAIVMWNANKEIERSLS